MVINVNKLGKLTGSVRSDIKNYETYIYDLLSTLKNMKFYWYDGYTTSFFKQVDDMGHDINDLINALYSMLDSLNVISSNYSSINHSKGNIGSWGIVRTSDFYIREDDDEEMIDRKNSLMRKVSRAEDNVSGGISKIKSFLCRNFSFTDFSVSRENSNLLGMKDNMATEIKKFSSKLSSYNKYSNPLISDLYSLGNIYSSSNVRNFSAKVDVIQDSLNRLNRNFNNAYTYVENRKKTYKKTFENLAKETRNIDFNE